MPERILPVSADPDFVPLNRDRRLRTPEQRAKAFPGMALGIQLLAEAFIAEHYGNLGNSSHHYPHQTTPAPAFAEMGAKAR